MFYPDIANHFYDFSEVNRLRFTQWLATRYAGNIGALNAAWNTEAVNPASMTTVPSPCSVSRANPLRSRGKISCVVRDE